jgi:hypothetical protein
MSMVETVAMPRQRFWRKTRPWWSSLLVAVAFFLLALRQHLFVDSYAVNVMFWDQWDFYRPLFQGGNLWELFSWQHGPHRQGVGAFLIAIVAKLSGWNSRWDAFAISFVLIAAALLGLQLARRCGLSGVALIVIPLVFFNLRQYEIFVCAANVSHGAMPVLLLMAVCLSWFIERDRVRYGVLVLITFLSIFTGFGLFTGLVVPLLLLCDLWHRRRQHHRERALWLALVGIALTWLLFAQGYRFDPAVQGFYFPHERPWEYLLFMAGMINNFFGIRGQGVGSMSFGMGILLFLATLTVVHGYRLWRNGLNGQARSAVLVTLALFSLLFCCQTAVGRVVLGWKEASTTSRYVPLMIPLGLAIYLYIATLPSRFRPQLLCVVFALVLAIGTFRMHGADKQFIAKYSFGRLTWKAAYLATGDMGKAGELSKFNIYPAMQIDDRLDFLRRHKLNLFNPHGRP